MKSRVLNWKPDQPDSRDFKYLKLEPINAEATKITKVDLRPLMSPVFDQGDIGSCTGNAIAGALEYLELLGIKDKGQLDPEEFGNTFEHMSRLFIYYNERYMEGDVNEDGGATLRDGIMAIRQWGVCRESIWPYSEHYLYKKPSNACFAEAAKHKILSGYRITSNNLLQMRSCLIRGFPFVLGISVYDSFMGEEAAATGIIPMPQPQDQIQGGHAICCVGFDDEKKHFIIRNSWGANWGDKGYCYIPYEYLISPLLSQDFWTIRR